MTTVREFITRWGFDVDFSQLEKMESEQKKLRTGFVKLGAVATAALASIVVPSATLEDALRKSAAAAGKTGTAFDDTLTKLTGQAQDLAEQLGLSGVEIGRGFFDVISSGVDPLTKDFDAFAATGLRLAKITGGDVGEAIEQMNTSIKAFGLQTGEATIIADKFVKANTLGATSVGQLANAASIAGPVMSQTVGQSLDTTTALLIGFAEAGQKAQRGGESLKQVALRLAVPIGEAGKTLEDLKVKTTNADGSFRNLIDIIADIDRATSSLTEQQKAQALANIFGQETVGKFSALLGIGIERLRGFETALVDSDGAMALALAQMEGLMDVGRKLFQSFKNIFITFGSPLLGPLTKVSNMFLGMSTSFRALLKESPGLTKALSLVGGSILGVVIAASALGASLATFNLMRIAIRKVGTELLLTQLKGMAAFVLLAAAGVSFFLVIQDLVSAMNGQKSLIIDFFRESSTGAGLLAGGLLGIGLAAMVAFAPMISLAALVGVLGTTIFQNMKKYKQFAELIANQSFGETLSQFGDWLDDLLGISTALEAINSWILEIGQSTSDWLNQTFKESAKEGLDDFAQTVTRLFTFNNSGAEGITSPASAPLPPALLARPAVAGGRSVEFNVGGINIFESENAEETANKVREELDRSTQRMADSLLP